MYACTVDAKGASQNVLLFGANRQRSTLDPKSIHRSHLRVRVHKTIHKTIRPLDD